MSVTVKLFRLGNFFHRNKLTPLGKMIPYINRVLFTLVLASSASLGKKFKVGYGGIGVVDHHNTIIGNNVTIAQNVTIGRNFGDNDVPQIGNDVYIGAGSVVFGEIKIGNNVIIG